MPGAAAPVPGVAVGVELVAVDETRVLVALVVAVEEVGVLDVAPPALASGGGGRCRNDSCRHCKKTKKSNHFEMLASEVVKLRETTTWVHDCKWVSKIMRQEFKTSSPDLSQDWEKETTNGLNVVWTVGVCEKMNQWVPLTVLVAMNSFKPIINTQLMR